ncbi:MAG: M23 family metallopeptidase [Bacillota bacterium]
MRRKTDGPYITITVVPHDGKAVRAVRLRRGVLDAFRAGLGLLIVVSLWLADSYITALNNQSVLRTRLDLQLDRYALLERAYLEEQSRYAGLIAQTLGIEQELQDLAKASAEIRQMLVNADAAPPPAPPVRQVAKQGDPAGQGGPPTGNQVIPVVTAALKNVNEQLRAYDDHIKALRATTLEFVRRRAHTPSIWPTEGWLSSGFGPRRHPVTGDPDYHYGLDIAGLVGTDILATADGTVVVAGRRSGYGLTIVIDHGYGLRTFYAHLSSMKVKVGQRVTKGQVIGAMGSTGISTGPHLHYEVHVNGRPVNPLNYLP